MEFKYKLVHVFMYYKHVMVVLSPGRGELPDSDGFLEATCFLRDVLGTDWDM